jgi:hypothetical protein
MLLLVVVPFSVPMSMVAAFTPAVVSVMVPVALAVVRGVDVGVPGVLDEIDAFAAGLVFPAVFGPVLRVTRPYAEIDRLGDPHALHHQRFAIEDPGGGRITYINTPVEAGVTDGYRYADVLCEYRNSDECRGDQPQRGARFE